MSKQRVFSGIQPTGDIHLGNYLGALKNWVRMQSEYDTVYCVVDLHAITTPMDPAELREARIRTGKILLAVGIDPEHSMVYYQSDVPQHSELSWILSTYASMGHLGRMTQYKEKADKGGQNLGLFSYPVLMAADIVIHKVHAVPVGDDQTQHLEFTRDLVERFNARHGDVFPVPEQITPDVGARIMSLKDPLAKMSKSDPDPKSKVLVTDGPDVIRKKIRGAVTDSGRGVEYDVESKAGVSNLLGMLSAFTDRSIDDLVAEYHELQYGYFKDVVADAVIESLALFHENYNALSDAEALTVMAEGAKKALVSAQATIDEVKRVIGLD
ncbi:MAG: tryptophan--tRNA ligase [Acidimicrobiia bacterium]|nr:tryptophan--tRNA ligase [Acidimicrobiia bacterium]